MKRRQTAAPSVRSASPQQVAPAAPQLGVCTPTPDWLLDAQGLMGNQAALAAMQSTPAPAAPTQGRPPTTTYGRAPTDRNGVAQGPYGHLTTNPGGFSLGAGLLNGPLDRQGSAQGNVLSANLNAGRWYDETGRANYGLAGDATLARVGMPTGGALGPVGFDVGVLSANAGAQANDSTASIGAQANIIDGSVSLGNKEHMVRGGLSAGVGLAGRAHYGDADQDGVRELGVGADFGPFSFDARSELLGHAWNGIKGAWNWATGQ